MLNGTTHQGGPETRGRKHKLGPRAVRALDAKRRHLVEKTKGAIEATWQEIIKKARVTLVHPTTARKSLVRAGIPVASRRPREKPERVHEHVVECRETCGRWRYLPNNFFSENVDLIIDNKKFEVPTTEAACSWRAKAKVRHQIRTRSEGLQPQYTKPNSKRNRKNLGGVLNVCAGVSKDRIVLWKYLDGTWNADAAVKIYSDDIKNVFRRRCPDKISPTIVEDNDPTGYKSSKAIAVKKDLKYKIMSLPPSSPDLNPLDFCIWADIERRMKKGGPKRGAEAFAKYKERLRKTAMSTSPAMITKALASMPKRILAVYNEQGNHIEMD